MLWKKLNHDHILPFLGVSEEVFKNSFCMIAPWMENGSVRNYMEVIMQRNGKRVPIVDFINQWVRYPVLDVAHTIDGINDL